MKWRFFLALLFMAGAAVAADKDPCVPTYGRLAFSLETQAYAIERGAVSDQPLIDYTKRVQLCKTFLSAEDYQRAVSRSADLQKSIDQRCYGDLLQCKETPVDVLCDRAQILKSAQRLGADTGRIDQVISLARAADQKACVHKNITIRGKILGNSRNQGAAPSCYSQPAADMATKAYGKKISAAYIAVKYQLDQGADVGKIFSAGGSTSDAFNSANKDGFCLDENFRMDDSGSTSFADIHMKLSGPLAAQSALTADQMDGIFKDVHTIMPHLSKDDYTTIYQNSTPKNLYTNLMTKACAPLVKLDAKAMRVQPGSINEFRAALDKRIDQGELMSYSTVYGCVAPDAVGGVHEIAVVGREWRDNKCQYILRNSWGPVSSYILHASADTMYRCQIGGLSYLESTAASAPAENSQTPVDN